MNPIPDLLAWPNLLIMSFLPLKPYFLYRGQYSRYIKNIEYKTYITISLNSSLKILKKTAGEWTKENSGSGSDTNSLNIIKIR